MGTIYKIYNDINEKVYIGQTIQPLIRRWQAHIKDSKKKDTHLYRAMRLYGTEHFLIEVVETNIPEEELNAREIYWIEHFDSYHNGYNATPGGDCGTFEENPVYQYDLNGNFIAGYKSANDAERKTGCQHQNILKVCKGVLRQTNGFLWSLEQFEKLEMRPSKRERQVGQYDVDHELIKIWDKVKDAAEAIQVDPTHISRACRTQYKCHGFYWNYID